MDLTPHSDSYALNFDGAWLRQRNQNGVTVLHIGGEIDARNADKLGQYMCRIAAVAVALVVDTTAVNFMSAKGLRALVAIGEQCHDSGIEWALVDDNAVRPLLRVGSVGRAFPLMESVPAALQRITIATIGYGSGG